jgi:predicted aspartyl protease
MAMPCAISPLQAQNDGAVGKPVDFPEQPLWWVPSEGSGWISFDSIESGHIVIPVALNGQSVRAMIDTGSDHIVIDKAYAEAHHLPLTLWRKVGGFGTQVDLYTTPSVTLDIGAVRTTKAGGVVVSDLRGFADMFVKFDIIIGLPLLGVLEWQIDQDNHRFRMMNSRAIAIREGVAVRVGPMNSGLVTDVTINGKRVTPTLIDTGSDSDVGLTPTVAAQTGFREQTDMAALRIGNVVVSPLGRLTDFQIGNNAVTGAYASVDPTGWTVTNEYGAVVGMGVLRSYNMTVDMQAGRMALTARTTASPPKPKTTAGVQGDYHDGRWVIAHVMKNSPAEAAGLRQGDSICSINGRSMSVADRDWGRSAPGTRFSLTLCDGTSRTMTLRSFY